MPACATSWRCAAIRRAGAGTRYSPHPGGYVNAADLVAGLKRIGEFRDLGGRLSGEASRERVACRRHRQSQGQGRCRRRPHHHAVLLRQRLLPALSRARRARAASGCRSSPGIVPIHNFKQVAGFAGRCGATVPSWLARRFDGLEDDPQTTHLVAAAVADRAGHGPRRRRASGNSTSTR